MAKIVRYCVNKETHVGDNVFLIHRPFIFSNPFTHIKNKKTKAKYVVSTRDEAIDLYNDYFDEMLVYSKKFKEEFDKMYEVYKKYDTIYLGCYCSENESCHGDIIGEKLKKRSLKDMIQNVRKERQGV